MAEAESCAVSAVQATREHLLPHYGAVGGRRVPGRRDLYTVETVIEKPTPTEAELRLVVPGLRAGHYLCFFGMHVPTPAVLEILASQVARAQDQEGITPDAQEGHDVREGPGVTSLRGPGFPRARSTWPWRNARGASTWASSTASSPRSWPWPWPETTARRCWGA